MARISVPAVLGFYDDAHDLLDVTERARVDEKFANLDAYTPYPVHGLEDALGLKRSWVSTAARFALLGGWFLGFLFQSWTSAIDWPVNIGGKPFIAWPAWIPVTFEFGVLMASFTNLLCMFYACGLYPRPKTVVLSKRITNDRMVLVIPVKGDEEERRAVEFLGANHALKIKIIDGFDAQRQRLIFRATPMTGEVTR
ncbi:DUF3341 domain-containing protein [Candidatus Sumerlaeota bacterium]|nr:DUF3341 domain-containing protein [Candidatus Sumerlaeota bacterium]